MLGLMHMLEAQHAATCPLCQQERESRPQEPRRRWFSAVRRKPPTRPAPATVTYTTHSDADRS